MVSFFVLSLALTSIVASMASPMPANPFRLPTPVCGPSSSNGNGICVDHDAIMSKPHAVYVSEGSHYSISQCTAACRASSQCKSIAYYNANTNVGPSWRCEMFSEPVTPYTIKCGDPRYDTGATPFAHNNSAIGGVFNPAGLNASALSNYFEKDCGPGKPMPDTNGEVPSADGDQLLCGAWTPTQKSFADLFIAKPNNTQTQCRDLCRETPACKSYWWIKYSTPSSQPFGQGQMNEPEVTGDCAFFSQPIKKHGEFSEYPLPMFDVNCSIGNGTFY